VDKLPLITAVMPLSKGDNTVVSECPSKEEMDEVVKAYTAALEAQPGVVSVTLIFVNCDWIVSGAALLRPAVQGVGTGHGRPSFWAQARPLLLLAAPARALT
jgi:hypothetical protein